MQRVAFIYNTVPDSERIGVFAECASCHTITAIEQALIQGGNELFPVNLKSRRQLERVFAKAGGPDFAFVIAEGLLEQPVSLYNGCGAALIREILAELNVPFSHSSAAAMGLCRHKELTYQVLHANSVSYPWHLCLTSADIAKVSRIEPGRFPLFVKPGGGGNSVGIDSKSVVHTPEDLTRRIQELTAAMGPIGLVVERYLPGTEYTVGVIGNLNPVVLPPIAFPKNLIRSSEVKRMEGRSEIPIHAIDPQEPLYLRLRELALKAFTALGCADAIRIDIKADLEGNLYVIDVNGTPSLAPSASLAKMAAAAGLDYTDFVNLLLYYGLHRTGLAGSMPEQVAAAEEKLNILRTEDQVVA